MLRKLNAARGGGFIFQSDHSVSSAVAGASYTVYLPDSGGVGAPTPNLNATVSNPFNGISVKVIAEDGGVLQLQVNLNGAALPAGYTATTAIYDAGGSPVATVPGAQPICQFTEPGVYLAVVALTDAQGNPVGKTAIALPISAFETGIAGGLTPPLSPGISSVSLKGKLLFSPGIPDSMSFKGTLELPAGLNLSQPRTLSVSIGNVTDTASLNAKGSARAGELNRLKNVAVRYPRLKRPAMTTSARQQATVSFMLSAPQLDSLGFAYEGISKQGLVAGQSKLRIMTVALVLGSTAYRADILVLWTLSTKGESGKVMSEK